MLTLSLLASGCVAGRGDHAVDLGDWPDGSGSAEHSGHLWPDLGGLPDAFVWRDGAPPDLPWQPDGPKPPDKSTAQPDAQPDCADSHEPNDDCFSASSLGSIDEGTSWKTTTATLHPANDIDWFAAMGLEGAHFCMPLTSQCYVFKARVQVPASRRFRLCLLKESCAASATCTDNKSAPGPVQLDVQYKVSGTCSLNDDTEARISIEPLDSSGGCTPYTLSINFDEC